MIKSFDQFLNEKYQKYSDFSGKWGTPEDIADDFMVSLKHVLPGEWDDKPIKSVTDLSDEEMGIKFEAVLGTGDIVHGYKTTKWRGDWEWYLNKKKKTKQEIYKEIEDKLFTPFEKWQKRWDMRDQTADYSDDHRVWKNEREREKYLEDLYKKLSPADKKKADAWMANK